MDKDLQQLLKQSKLNKSEILSLLGEPDLSKEQFLWSYLIGDDFIDCLSFDISFDNSNIAYRAENYLLRSVNNSSLIKHLRFTR